MSRRGRSNRQDDHNRKSDVYDEFKDHVHQKVRDRRNNPKVTVCAFDDMLPSGVTHLVLPLENVDNGDVSFLQKVESFREGTTCKPQNLDDGGQCYVARVPFVDDPNLHDEDDGRRHRSKHRSSRSSGGPSVLYLQAMVSALFILVIVCYMGTSSDQWRYLMGGK